MYTTGTTATRRNADYYPTMEQHHHCNRLTELIQNSDQSRQALQNFESYHYYFYYKQQQKNSNSNSEGGTSSCSSITCTAGVEQQDTTTRSENFFDQQQLRKSSIRNRPVFFLPRSIAGDVNMTNSTSNTSDAPRSSTRPAAPRGGPAVSTPSLSLPPPLVPESQESYLSRNEYHQHSWKEQQQGIVDKNEHELLLNRLSPINILPQEERFSEGKEVGTTPPQQQRQRIIQEEQELIQDFLLGLQSPQQEEDHDDKEYKSNENYLVTSSSSTTRKTSALPPCCNQDEKQHSSRRRHRGSSYYDGGAVAAPGNACYNTSFNHHGEEEYTKGNYQTTCIDPNHHRTQMTRIDNQSANISSGDCHPLPATAITMSSTTMQGAATADSSSCCCIPSLSSFHSSSTSCSYSPPIIAGRRGVMVATTTAANGGATRICAARALQWDGSSPRLLAHNNGDHLSSLHRSILSGPPPSFENDHETYSSCHRSLLSLARPHLPSRPLVNHL